MTKRRRALITGVTGQDGSYLAEFLLDKGYEVHGLKRRASSFNTHRIDHLYVDPHDATACFFLHYGDMTDTSSLIRVLEQVKPDEIYNLAAQSHVQVSFESPEYTSNVDALGTLRLLEALRIVGMGTRTRFYQASSSEMYGNSLPPQSENTPFSPQSPYATAKLFSYWTTINYRDAYHFHASNGILFNHESPIRGETFVTRKITRAVAAINLRLQKRLYIGNLNAKRDWGHARDYVEGMWLALQQERPDDYVLATGVSHSVREFVEYAFAEVNRNVIWQGELAAEKGIDAATGEILVEVDARYFRPMDVHCLVGDPSKAKERLGWTHKVGFRQLVEEMVRRDLERLQFEIENGTRDSRRCGANRGQNGG